MSGAPFECTPPGILFSDVFSYGSSSGVNLSSVDSHWTLLPGQDLQYDGTVPGIEFYTHATTQASFVASQVESYDDSAYTVSVSFKVNSISGGGGHPQIAIGLATGPTSTATAVGCVADFVNSGANYNIQIGPGTQNSGSSITLNSVSLAGAGVISSPNTSDTFNFVCTVARVCGKVLVTGVVTDITSPSTIPTQSSTLLTDLCGSGGCTTPYIAEPGNGFTTSGDILSYTLIGVP